MVVMATGIYFMPLGPFSCVSPFMFYFRHLSLILIHHKVRFDSWYLGLIFVFEIKPNSFCNAENQT